MILWLSYTYPTPTPFNFYVKIHGLWKGPWQNRREREWQQVLETPAQYMELVTAPSCECKHTSFYCASLYAFHRCCVFYKLKARISTNKKNFDSLYCGGLEPNLQYLWDMPIVQYPVTGYFSKISRKLKTQVSHFLFGKWTLRKFKATT